ncbi:DNA polymerase [Elysia marginata]|uniref:DNA polymerase n=1 Tax=Elysia marginata TaxID=1093978 RepID=A0AAV4ESW5_9GAST|nr:DNA polymerase [Elysia marginata]
MVDIDRKLMHLFPDSRCSHLQKTSGDVISPPTADGPRRLCETRAPRGAFLVLQLHDELVYETSEDVLPQVASLVKTAMERAVEMNVFMPVKLKVGPSWGELQDWDVA